MLALIEFVSLAALVAFHTLVAGVAARFFRLRLSPWSARALYTVVLTPVLFVSTLFFTGVLGVGTGLVVESPVIVVSLLVGLPLVLGVTIDYLYVQLPAEYELGVAGCSSDGPEDIDESEDTGDLEDDDAGSNETTEADETPSSEAADALETAEGYLFEAVDSIVKEIEITWANYSTALAYYSTVRPSSSFWNHAWEGWKYYLFLWLLLVVLGFLTVYVDVGLLPLALVVMVTVFLYKKASQGE